MKRILLSLITCTTILFSALASGTYQPTPENLVARKEFRESGLGIFIHWGIYSMFGQNEWYLNRGINAQEYAKAASAIRLLQGFQTFFSYNFASCMMFSGIGS